MQLFSKQANVLFRIALGVVGLSLGGSLFLVDFLQSSPYVTEVEVVRDQPVPFSHQHHVSGLGIDCRYCHTAVESSSFAGIPPTSTCMNCHTQMWADAPTLKPVRDSLRTGESIEWNRVHDLPDFVYFDHSIHIDKGVGCTTCHGPVHKMPLMYRENTLHMGWCLQCHKNPAPYLREPKELFNHDWKPKSELMKATEMVRGHHSESPTINCSVCHR